MIFKLSSNEMLSFFFAGAFLVLTLLVAFFSVVSVSFSVAGVNYLLVSDSEDEETEAYIMREVTKKDDEAVYEMVEDEGQLEALSKVFSELLDDVDIEM